MPFSLNKRGGSDICRNATKRKDYSRNIRLLKCLAPAKVHMWASSLILVTIIVVGVAALRKILAFRSFHISHETSIITEARAFLL